MESTKVLKEGQVFLEIWIKDKSEFCNMEVRAGPLTGFVVKVKLVDVELQSVFIHISKLILSRTDTQGSQCTDLIYASYFSAMEASEVAMVGAVKPLMLPMSSRRPRPAS